MPGATCPTPSDTTLILRAFGPGGLWRVDGTRVLDPGKPLALLVALAAAPNRAVSRDHALHLLWSHDEPARARHALSQTVLVLRGVLGGRDRLHRTASGLELDPELQVDLDHFEQALRSRRLEAALALYHGDFLENFALPGCAEFELWCERERQAYRTQFLRASEQVLDQLLTGGRYREASDLAARRCRAAPDSEEARCALLQVLHSAGDWIGLERQRLALADWLRQEGREPSAASRAWLGHAGSIGPSASQVTHVRFPDLVGRAAEFRHLLNAWDTVRTSGHGWRVEVSGDPGIGKSRLLADFANRLQSRGYRALGLRAYPAQRDVPDAFSSELVAALAELPGAVGVSATSARVLLELNPALEGRFGLAASTSLDGTALPRLRMVAIRELLEAVVENGPMVLLVDDAHWCDAPSSILLAALAEALGDLPVLVVIACRAHSSGRYSSDSQLSLRPLDPLQIRDLVGSVVRLAHGAWPPELGELLHRASAGSPLLVLEWLQLGQEAGWLRQEEGAWVLRDVVAASESLRRMPPIRHRIERLSRGHRMLILTLAVAGAALPLTLLAGPSGVSESELAQLVEELEVRGYVERGDRIGLIHDAVGEQAVAVAAVEELAQVHAGLAEAYLNSSSPTEADLLRAGRHFTAAGDPVGAGRCFARYLALARRQHDLRTVEEIGREFAGPAADGAAIGSLIATAPRYLRWRASALRGAGQLAVGGIALILGLMGIVVRQPAPPPLDLLVSAVDRQGHSVLLRAEVDTLGWEAGTPVEVKRGRVLAVAIDMPQFRTRLGDVHPNPLEPALVAVNGVMRDGGGLDAFLVSSEGVRRLTDAPGDDQVVDWSPDGRRLLLLTTRWSRADYDLMILDPATGLIERFADSPEVEAGGFWSPDGHRIAYWRLPLKGGGGPQICWAPPEEHPHSTCHSAVEKGVESVNGWKDADNLWVSVKRPEGSRLSTFSLSTGAIGEPAGALHAADLFRQGWRIIAGAPSDGASQGLALAPPTLPASVRPLVLADTAFRIVAVNPLPETRHAWTETLRIIGTPRVLSRGETHQLRMVWLTASGADASRNVSPRWTSSNPDVLEVDSGGLLLARSRGRVTIRVAIPGWRSDSTTIDVAGSEATLTSTGPAHQYWVENWSASWRERWLSFGTPSPTVVPAPDGHPALWNAGDGEFGSLVRTRRDWWGGDGVGVELRAWAPISRPLHQVLTIALGGFPEGHLVTPLEDTLVGIPDGAWDLAARACLLSLPDQEGIESMSTIRVRAGGTERRWDIRNRMRRGHPLRIRLQVFPDGRCGVALDNQPLGPPFGAVTLDRPFRVSLGMSSLGAQLLHGEVKVWQGVPGDIDWSLQRQ